MRAAALFSSHMCVCVCVCDTSKCMRGVELSRKSSGLRHFRLFSSAILGCHLGRTCVSVEVGSKYAFNSDQVD